MGRLAAFVAHQKNAIMFATGMAVGEVGVGALNPHGQIVAHKQIKDPVDAVGGHALATLAGKIVRNIIGRGRPFVAGQFGKDSFAHAGPLLARFGQRLARLIDQILARMFVMCVIVCRHSANIAAADGLRQLLAILAIRFLGWLREMEPAPCPVGQLAGWPAIGLAGWRVGEPLLCRGHVNRCSLNRRSEFCLPCQGRAHDDHDSAQQKANAEIAGKVGFEQAHNSLINRSVWLRVAR